LTNAHTTSKAEILNSDYKVNTKNETNVSQRVIVKLISQFYANKLNRLI